MLAVAVVGLSGCGSKTPSGQVVANVDGDDITRRDLVTELQASGNGATPSEDNLKKLQPALVQQVVNRKLLVAQAKKEGIDKTPEYLAAVQRAGEVLMVQQLIQRWGSKLDVPSEGEVQAFIAANPQMFGERKVFVVDQIRSTASGISPAQLQPLKTNDAVAAFLQSQRHPVERGQATLDSMQMSQAQYNQLVKLPAGEPIVAISDGMLMSNVISDIRNAPVPEDRQMTAAKAALAQQAGRTMVENQIRSLRQSAKIDYQPGFAPPAAPKGAAAPAGK
jgi:EpsD family peptidyl-prolyl cis-trans isomerase